MCGRCSSEPVGQLCGPAAAGGAQPQFQLMRSSLLLQLLPAAASCAVCRPLGRPAYWCRTDGSCMSYQPLFLSHHGCVVPSVYRCMQVLHPCSHAHTAGFICMAMHVHVYGFRVGHTCAPGWVVCSAFSATLPPYRGSGAVLCWLTDIYVVCRVSLRTPVCWFFVGLPCAFVGCERTAVWPKSTCWVVSRLVYMFRPAPGAAAAAAQAPACNCRLDSLCTCVVHGLLYRLVAMALLCRQE